MRLVVVAAVLILAAGCDGPRRGSPATPSDAMPPSAASESPADAASAIPEANAVFALVVPGRGVLTLAVPAETAATQAESSVPGGAAVRLEGTGPESYVTLLTVMGVSGMMPGFGADAWFAEELERWRDGLSEPQRAAGAVPVEFQLDRVHGVYLNLADPAPQPGHYPYLTQGFFDVDGCIVALQTLHHSSRASAVNRYLAVLKDALWEPENTPPPDVAPLPAPEKETPPDIPAAQ